MTHARRETKSLAAEHRTVSRVMVILEMVAASEPSGLRLGDMSTPINAPKSSIHGLTKGLVAVGYLQEQEGRYYAGPALYSLLGSLGERSVPAAYVHAIRELTDKWEESSFIAMRAGDSMIYVERADSPRAIRALPAMNIRVPLWPRSAGKCFLAFMDPGRLEVYLRRTFLSTSERDRVREDLLTVHEQRLAVNLGETEADQCGIAAPILKANGRATNAIAIAGPIERMKPHLDQIIESVHWTAVALSSRDS